MSAKARRILTLLKDSSHRERMLQAMNRENLDDVGPLAGDKGEKFLSELNKMEDLETMAGQRGPAGRSLLTRTLSPPARAGTRSGPSARPQESRAA
jgi:hypothetical protein